MQIALAGVVEQLLVGHTAPEEIRQPRRQFPVGDGMRGVARRFVDFDAEDEVRRREHRFQGESNARVEGIAVLFGRIDETEEASDLVVADGPAPGAFGEGLEYFAGAVAVFPGAVRHGDEDAFAGLVGFPGGVDDFFGGGEVLFHEDRRHGEHVADVVEAVADVVGGEVVGRVEGDADEVADGVVVFGAVEPANGDAAGVFGAGGAIGLEHVGVEPGVDGVEFGRGRFRLALRRHHAAAQVFGHFFPDLRLGEDGRLVLEGVEVEVAARLGAAVTPDAVFFDDGPHAVETGLGGRRLGPGGGASRQRASKDQEQRRTLHSIGSFGRGGWGRRAASRREGATIVPRLLSITSGRSSSGG